ncbi:MAG: hypothetical protein ABJA85_08330 [Bacteroidota bacterium]
MKKFLFLFVLVAISTAGFSQTKKIAHRSHSGKNSSFTIAGIDNFGETPEMVEARKKKELERAKMDSTARKAVADSLARVNSKPAKKSKKKKNSVVIKDSINHS